MKRCTRRPFRKIITFILDFPYNTYEKVKVNVGTKSVIGATVVEWLSSWLAEQEVREFDSRSRHLNFKDWLSPAFKT